MRARWQAFWFLVLAVLCFCGCERPPDEEKTKSKTTGKSEESDTPTAGAGGERGDEPVGGSSRTREEKPGEEGPKEAATAAGNREWGWEGGSQTLSPQLMNISPEPMNVLHGVLLYEARFASDGAELAARMGPILSGSETDIHKQIEGYGIFDTETLELKRAYTLPEDAGKPLAHALNGGVLAVTAGEELLVWAGKDDRPVRIESGGHRLSDVAVDDDGRRVIARRLGAPFDLLLHDLKTSETVTLEQCNRVGSMHFVKGGVLCRSEADREVTRLVDYNGEVRITLEGKVLAVSPGGRRVLVRRGKLMKGEVTELSLPDGEPTGRFQEMPGELQRVVGTRDGWLVDSGHTAPTSIVHYTESGPRPYPARRGRMHPVHDLGMHGESVVYEYDVGIEKYDAGRQVEGDSHVNPGGAVSFGQGGTLLSQPHGLGVMPIQHWDLESESLRKVASFPDGMKKNGDPRIWMPLARRALGTPVPTSQHGQVVFAGNGDGPVLVLDTTSGDGAWHLVDPDKDTVIANPGLPRTFLKDLGRRSAIADSGEVLVTINGQVVTVISMETGEERCRYVLQKAPRWVKISPGGALIATWDGSNTAIHNGLTCQPIVEGDEAPMVMLPEPTVFGESSVKLVEPQVVFIDDQYLLATMKDFDVSHLLRWDGEQMVHEGNLSFDKQFPEGAARSGDGELLAVSYPGAMVLWELETVLGAKLGE